MGNVQCKETLHEYNQTLQKIEQLKQSHRHMPNSNRQIHIFTIKQMKGAFICRRSIASSKHQEAIPTKAPLPFDGKTFPQFV